MSLNSDRPKVRIEQNSVTGNSDGVIRFNHQATVVASMNILYLCLLSRN